MEKTIKNKKPKTPKKEISTLQKQLEFFKKHSTNDNAKPTRLDFEEGKLHFRDVNGKAQVIDTSEEILFHAPGASNQFHFGKPVLFMQSFNQIWEDEEEEWDEDEDDYVYNEVKCEYKVVNIYLFYLITTRYGNSFVIETSRLKDTYTAFDLANGQKSNVFNSSSVAPDGVKTLFKNIKSRSESYNYGGEITKKSNLLFIDGKRYIDDEIDSLEVSNALYTGELLQTFTNTRAYMEQSFKAEDYAETPTSFNELYHFNKQAMPAPLLLCDKSNNTKKIVIKNWIYNNIRNANIASEGKMLNLTLINLIIDFENRNVDTTKFITLPKMINHADCCGANLPYHHGYSHNFWNTAPQELFDKVYCFHLAFNKADKVVFLTDNQVVASVMMYNNIFGKENVTKIHSYPNMNSGNNINIYHINCTNKLEKLVEIENEGMTGTAGWDYRSKVSSAINSSLSLGYLEKSQWFENSELVETKGVKKVPTTKNGTKNTVINTDSSGFAAISNLAFS
jgi:hypothetical protein